MAGFGEMHRWNLCSEVLEADAMAGFGEMHRWNLCSEVLEADAMNSYDSIDRNSGLRCKKIYNKRGFMM